tara:strand:- start:76 stop:294 length:219 start_codon:yes stop_codon:yes gene_type:complete
MSVNKFKNIEEVMSFIENEYDSWISPIIEDYLTEVGDIINVKELNGWIENEYLEMSSGYEKWIEETYIGEKL